MSEKQDAAYICPYYKRDRGCGNISCECASFKFPDLIAKDEYVHIYCGSTTGYKLCPLYGILERYYWERVYKER